MQFKGQKFLVTGCAGFIGSFITEALLAKGAYVLGIDNLNTGSLKNIHHPLKNPHFEFIKADFCNKGRLSKLVNRVDYIFHGAVRGIGLSTDNPLKELKVNIQGTLLLLELMRRSKVKRLIFASSASVYGDPSHLPETETDPTFPLSPYGVSKLAAEHYVIAYHHLYKLPVVALRYFNIYGPRQRNDSLYGGVVSIFLHNALHNKPLLVYGGGNQTRDFTYIDDAVKATIDAFFAKEVLGKVLNVSGGKEYTITQLAKKVKEISSNPNLPILHAKKRLVDNVNR
ncbi:MAG: GDP-mannose 4,6-dehydratase, partial [Candidatus Daviesbacteria bacterium]|nr:GDP-mannose 4,6-dehydratase [Candidatus Daviesbacteria bacterium]